MQQLLKILHLEDVSDDAELIHRELRKANLQFEICVVDNKEDYKRELDNFCPHIILSDHSLPFFNSHEALALLQETNNHIPFILVTATVSEEFAVGIIKNGATDYILKDRLQRLPTAILKAVENSRVESEHKNFLQEIISNEALMNDAQALANFGSFSINLLSKTIDVSNETYLIFGFQPGDCKPSYRQLNTNGTKKGDCKIQISLGEVRIDLCESKKNYTVVDKNGRLKFISAEFKVERSPLDEAIAIKGFFYNITKLKAAENLLQESQANLKTIFETTDTGYVLVSKERKILSFNKKAVFFIEDQTGLALKEGVPFLDYVGAKRKEFVANAITKAINNESTAQETNFINSTGETKWFFLRWLPVTGNNNRNHGVILVISDITGRKLDEIEREKIAADLIARNNALEQFTYIVSHNLRAPVANIMGLAGILKNAEHFQPSETAQFLSALDTSILQLDDIVVDLNKILRISQRTNEVKEIVYFQQLVEDVKAEFSGLITKSGAVICTHFFDRIYMSCIKSFLYNIFYNLISNSMLYRKESEAPLIEIKSVLLDNRIQLIFTDNGKGIDLEKFGKKLFGLYQRFDNSINGKGMGLCIVKALSDNMGGTIKVYSEVNAGTTFVIEFPI